MKNFLKAFKPLDIVIIILVIIAIFLSYVKIKNRSGDWVVIKTPFKKIICPLKKNTYIKVKGRRGITLIEIKEKKVRIVKSSCPNKICIKTGWIKKVGDMIVCVPNGIIVKIEGKQRLSKEGKYDFITK